MQSESIKSLMAAVKTVQQSAGTVQKGTQGQVGSRAYKYANLNDTWDAVKPLLASNGLTVVQSPVSGDNGVGNYFETTIYHDSGEWLTKRMFMVVQREDPQALGAAITYYRRYMLTSILGLIPDDDNDAREHRLATAEQKRELVAAIKLVEPELSKPDDIVKAITNVVGKHPSNIREDEAPKFIDLIKAFKS